MLETHSTLLQVAKRLSPETEATFTLLLPWSDRQKSRQRVSVTPEIDVALVLERGEVIRSGDIFQLTDGQALRILGAAEPVSIITLDHPTRLAKEAWHLGNRHVPVDIQGNQIMYLQDSVLDGMMQKRGHVIQHTQASFDPMKGWASGYHRHHDE